MVKTHRGIWSKNRETDTKRHDSITSEIKFIINADNRKSIENIRTADLYYKFKISAHFYTYFTTF